jgi:hypothetical protein
MSVTAVKLIAGTGVWITFALLLMSGFSTWYIIDRIVNPTDKAFEIQDFTVINPVVAPGEVVVFSLTGARYHNCPSIIASFWMDEDGAPVTRFPPLTGGYTPLDPDGYTIPVRIPAPDRDTVTGEPVPPGIYHYRSLNAPLCRHLSPTETPDAVICLVRPDQPKPPCATDPGALEAAVQRWSVQSP